MTTPITGHARIPRKYDVIYKAAQYIFEYGPQADVALFQAIDFGPREYYREKLRRAFSCQWLVQTPEGVDITELAREHFAGPMPKIEYVGQMAGPRFVDLMNRPAYVPPRRLVRADALDNSLQAMPSHYGKGNP